MQATKTRKLLWDEENRLLGVSDNGFVSQYWYDAAGERTVKMSGDAAGVFVNGVLSGGGTNATNFTAYISPYTVLSNGGRMSKHIYMGTQRIASKLIDAGTMADPRQEIKASPANTTLSYTGKYSTLRAALKARYDSLGVSYTGDNNTASEAFYTAKAAPARETEQYFFHSDHLGSSSLITDINGETVQHLEYVPFGETFIDERRSADSWTTPYLFSGKERDVETGLLYVHARYQDSKYGVWYSVDPLAEKYPNWSSYVYTFNNPINYVDPDGKRGRPSRQMQRSFQNNRYALYRNSVRPNSSARRSLLSNALLLGEVSFTSSGGKPASGWHI